MLQLSSPLGGMWGFVSDQRHVMLGMMGVGHPPMIGHCLHTTLAYQAQHGTTHGLTGTDRHLSE